MGGFAMTEQALLQAIQTAFADARVSLRRARRVEVHLPSPQTLPALAYLKTQGFGHLVAISCVDWIKENSFELVYHLWSYQHRIHVMVKTRIPREQPEMPTARQIFRIAQTYERDIHEMFGVNFPGNPRLIPFVLEDWQGPPPLRKDFDTRRFAEEVYGMRTLETELFTRREQPYKGFRKK